MTERFNEPLQSAETLRSELTGTFEALKIAVSNFEIAHDRAGKYLNANGVVPPPTEGLSDDLNELYLAWDEMPTPSEFQALIK